MRLNLGQVSRNLGRRLGLDAPVPRFFLSLRDGDFLPDMEGQDFADVDAARIVAVKGAREIMAEDIREGILRLNESVEITDEGGVLRARVLFRDTIAIDPPNAVAEQ